MTNYYYYLGQTVSTSIYNQSFYVRSSDVLIYVYFYETATLCSNEYPFYQKKKIQCAFQRNFTQCILTDLSHAREYHSGVMKNRICLWNYIWYNVQSDLITIHQLLW